MHCEGHLPEYFKHFTVLLLSFTVFYVLTEMFAYRLETTEATGVFAFIFRFLFFFFLIALLGGALPFHLLALSVLCLLIYFAIYLVNNFFYL